ncbi:ABC transporter substrate-binding protein [Roseiarcus fermentans]|nr:ABC transporter substrate-binding protein [Roseiarcus fermentans]
MKTVFQSLARRGRQPAILAISFATAISAIAAPAGVGAPTHPQRIVSINMCTDELLLRLVDRDRIASVTWLSQDPGNANMAEAAAGIPANHGLAEEVAAFHPDLVLAGTFTSRTTKELLRKLGFRVVEFGVPTTLEGVRQQIRNVASAVGEPAKGDAIVADMDARLDRLASEAHRPPLNAIVLRPNGYTVGKASLVNELMERAGLLNLAEKLGFASYLQIPLEAVALQKADVLILDADASGPPSLATEALRHPVVRELGERLRLVSVPSRLWTCAGPSVVDAVERLIDGTRAPVAEASP